MKQTMNKTETYSPSNYSETHTRIICYMIIYILNFISLKSLPEYKTFSHVNSLRVVGYFKFLFRYNKHNYLAIFIYFGVKMEFKHNGLCAAKFPNLFKFYSSF